MSDTPRHELGDPVFAAIDAETRRDHAVATARGARLARLSAAVVSDLVGRGLVSADDDARVAVFSVLADHLYGDAAIDVPTLRPASDSPSDSGSESA